MWTGVRLLQGNEIVGVSNGYGQGGSSDPAVATTLFLARVLLLRPQGLFGRTKLQGA